MDHFKHLVKVFDDYRLKRDFFDKKTLSDELAALKKKNFSKREELLKITLENLKKHGFEVFVAKDKTEAQEIIKNLVADKKKIVKSKSNVGKEIDLTQLLEKQNCDVKETDLGDWLSVVCASEEIHPVLPAVQLSEEFIVGKIKESYGVSIEAKAEAIAAFARQEISQFIAAADVGITGVNAISASGELMILENEGNISKVSRLPAHHIAISGIEKIVENLSETLHVAKCAAVWGTGQDWPVYVSIIAGPSKTADIQNKVVVGAQGAQRVSLVLIDNGRSAMAEKYPELWNCINCGACANFCPAYYQLLEKFGYKYLGAKGLLWTAFNESLQKSKEGNLHACTLCEACGVNCPAQIPLPQYIRHLRQDLIKSGDETEGNKEMMEHVRKYGNPFGEVKEGEIPDKLYCC
jgi:L-lactate utilization protein LutB